ncbi:MarR family winged helix-turn-helix transcriptional regulator [Phenylobacterium sp.]|uniref:MarR family winged helix-turn-helix transcriptional regulator n=1 Tax=Phenylobacterium sp. TaxID=1871053 RepID=UPI0027226E88|nr:MarR family transcriptional regulator [Phenylobacterium sp.]MDO8799792.1 MarR family transcriptional regulator [Phenylobacterium sp.]
MPTLTEDPVALAETLRPALLRVSRRLRQEAQKAGVSALDALLLNQIARDPGIGVCDLADREQLSRPTMSGHIKRLEAAGWIARADSATDGRRSGLAVTSTGQARLDEIRRRRNDWLAARLAQLPPQARAQLDAAAGPLLQLLSLEA